MASFKLQMINFHLICDKKDPHFWTLTLLPPLGVQLRTFRPPPANSAAALRLSIGRDVTNCGIHQRK